MNEDNKSVAVYLRVSTENSKNGHTQSTQMQKLEIETYLKAKGITEFEIYEDVGFSGTKKNRPALKKLMQDCKNGKISVVVCYKLDRLFRSLQNMIEVVAEFQKLEIEFVAVKDNINLDSASGKLMFHIIACFAEFEAATIKERINSGLANARSKGVRLGRPFKKGHSVVAKLKSEGRTVKEIADHTGLSRATVYKTLKQGEVNG